MSSSTRHADCPIYNSSTHPNPDGVEKCGSCDLLNLCPDCNEGAPRRAPPETIASRPTDEEPPRFCDECPEEAFTWRKQGTGPWRGQCRACANEMSLTFSRRDFLRDVRLPSAKQYIGEDNDREYARIVSLLDALKDKVRADQKRDYPWSLSIEPAVAKKRRAPKKE